MFTFEHKITGCKRCYDLYLTVGTNYKGNSKRKVFFIKLKNEKLKHI